MSGSATSFVSARLLLPDYIVQAQDNALSCPLWQGGTLIAPDSGTISVYDPSNTAVISAASVTVVDDVATYTVLSTSLPSTLSRGMGWRVEWALVIDGSTTTYRNSAGLIKCPLAPVVTDADLYRRESALDPDGNAPVSSLTTYQDYIDEAWVTLHGRLVAKGNLPNRILEPSALREPHLLLTLSLILQDFRTRLNETWAEKAKEYEAKWEKAYDGLAVEYDTTDSGQSDGRRKRSASPTIWLGGFD